jgi:hypothetical protein
MADKKSTEYTKRLNMYRLGTNFPFCALKLVLEAKPDAQMGTTKGFERKTPERESMLMMVSYP